MAGLVITFSFGSLQKKGISIPKILENRDKVPCGDKLSFSKFNELYSYFFQQLDLAVSLRRMIYYLGFMDYRESTLANISNVCRILPLDTFLGD